MRYEPLANRVIMEEIKEGKQSRGLWIPDIARKNKGVGFGRVIAVGPGRLNAEGKHIPVHVKAGDVVLFPLAAPATLPLTDENGDEREVLMCPENDLIAVVHDLPRETGILDDRGVPLTIAPQSLALPDLVYANREGVDRSLSDLKQVHAPPDVLAEVAAEQVDQREYEPDLTEH